ncbi:hypothetical protein CAEBREN_06570 [Caenorhabditis brenneri]|uniref:F-box domain-containing protein n=1 Tax=Caenorhabditis brenneri TaxID=135651 RepID=G0NMK6_CAEBE|nr:hypothetical protein CAEBREN_06570 [Caenorhabditis brenneri]
MEWTNFPAKDLVLRFLDYEARCNLRVCSKQNRDLIDSSGFVASRIVLVDIPSNMDAEKSILRLSIDTFTIWFIGKHEKTRIERAWNGEPMEICETKLENRVDILKRFIEKFLKNGLFEATTVKIIRTSMEPSENWRIKCTDFTLISPGTPSQWILNWMNKVETQLKELDVQNWTLEGISEIPCVLTVSNKLHLADAADFGDEQLATVEATDLQISSTNITPVGIKRAFEHYLKNGRPNDSLLLFVNIPEDFDMMTIFPKEMKIQNLWRISKSAWPSRTSDLRIEPEDIPSTHGPNYRY